MELEIEQKRFLNLLDQFVGNVPFEMKIIDKVLSQLPTQAKEGFINEMYYKHIYSGPLYIVQHCNFKTDVQFFTNLEMVKKFLISICLEDSDYLKTLSDSVIRKKMQKQEPICGYFITLGEMNDDTRQQYFG